MAVLKWNPEARKIEVNEHNMSGKPLDASFDDTYAIPVDIDRASRVKNILSSIYSEVKPDDIKVLGTPWDYSLSESPELHQGTVFGHYRVQIGDMPEAILCVNRNNGNEAITIGGELFERYAAADIDTLGPIKLPNDQFTAEVEGAHVHLEEFRASTKALFNSKLDGRQRDIGRFVGAITKVGASLTEECPNLDLGLKKYSDDTTIRCVERGLGLIKEDAGLFDQINKTLDSRQEKLKIKSDAELTSLFNELSSIIGVEVPRIARDPHRFATTFNMIDKMVVDNADGSFAYKSYDTPVRGHLAMVTENATHDVGFAVGRIISDPKLYDGSDLDITKQIVAGLDDYVSGYNDVTGRSLTVAEAIKAAKLVSAFNLVQGLGYNALSGAENPQTNADLADHIVTNTIPEFKRLTALSRHLGL